MVEKEVTREKEADLVVPIDPYGDYPIKDARRRKDKALKGRKVIKGKEIPFNMSRMAIHRNYAKEWIEDLCNDNWNIFVQDIRTHSGKHVHQGGLVLFVLKGKGYTVVDGHRFDWEEGDLICLPVKKGGVEHQHFNLTEEPSRWCAFIFSPQWNLIGRIHEMKEFNPFWREPSQTK